MAKQLTSNRLKESFRKKDKYGEELFEGDVCVWTSKVGSILCVYAGVAPYGKTGQVGLFHTGIGKKSIPYKSIVLMYDPMGRKIRHDEAKRLVREFYG